MFVRILKPEEKWMAHHIQAVAFEMPYDAEKIRSGGERPARQLPEGLPGDLRAPLEWAAGEGDEAYSCLRVYDFPVRFDGHTVLMGGIGGVATLPQHRGRGAVRVCMHAALEDMYDHGYVLSALYPFSTAFYRRFGYADGADICTVTAPMSALKQPDAGGSIELILPGSDLSALTSVYNAASRSWNLSTVRREYSPWLAGLNWMAEKRYLYLWRDEAGEAGGFMLMQKHDGLMDCASYGWRFNALMFRDARALSALLGFAGRFAADYTGVRFDLPAHMHVEALIPDACKATRTLSGNGMLRLVNARRALELCRTRGEGCVRIGVSDPVIDRNCGVWQVEFGGGESRVKPTDAAPDVELDVGSLSQLTAGVRECADIPMLPGARILNPAAPLDKLFYRKPCLMTEQF